MRSLRILARDWGQRMVLVFLFSKKVHSVTLLDQMHNTEIYETFNVEPQLLGVPTAMV